MSREKRQSKWDSKEPTGSNYHEHQLHIPPNQRQRRSRSRSRERGKDSNTTLATPPPVPARRSFNKAEMDALNFADIRKWLDLKVFIAQPLPPLFQLSDLVRRYPNCMPVRVRVQNGYHNSAAQLAITQKDVYDIHFIKHAKVVTLKDKGGNEELSLPLNSAVEFAILYNPKRNEDEARKGFLFKNVAEMCASKPLPLIVKATSAYKGSSPESSVEAGELLLLTGVKSSFGRGKQLQACSFSNGGGEKLLQEKCAGAFSTKPDDVRMTLAMMVQHKLKFPQTVLIYPDRELDTVLPSSIASSPVSLEGYKGETSIVATQVHSTSVASTCGDRSVLDIHLDVEIDVEAVELDERSQMQLAAKTLAIFNSFDATNVKVYMGTSILRRYKAQAMLYQHTERDLPNGIQLQRPILLGRSPTLAEAFHPETKSSTKTPVDMPQPGKPAPHLRIMPSSPPPDSEVYDNTDILQPPPPDLEASEDMYQALDFSQVSQEENPYTMPLTTSIAGPLKLESLGTKVSEGENSDCTERFPDASAHVFQGKERCTEGSEHKSVDFMSEYLELLNALDRRVERLEFSQRDILQTITKLSKECCQIREQLWELESRLHQ